MGAFARPIVGNLLRIGLGLERVLSFSLEVVLLLDRSGVSLRIFRIFSWMFRERTLARPIGPLPGIFSRLEDNLLLKENITVRKTPPKISFPLWKLRRQKKSNK